MVQAWKNLNRPNSPTLQNGVERAETDVKPAMGPHTLIRADAQQHISGEESAEEHDFRGQEEPDADLGVIDAGIRPGFYSVGDFHEIN